MQQQHQEQQGHAEHADQHAEHAERHSEHAEQHSEHDHAAEYESEIRRLTSSLDRATAEKLQMQHSLKQLNAIQTERAKELDQLQIPRISDPLITKVDAFLLSSSEPSESSGNGTSGTNGHAGGDQTRSLVIEMRDRIVSLTNHCKKLSFELDMEVGHVSILKAEALRMKQQAIKNQSDAEREEECIANKLMQRIQTLKREKEELLIKVEEEEEQITSALQRKLAQLQKEKIDMEVVLEQEQEFIVNRLQRQLETLRLQQQNPSASSPSSKKGWLPSHTPPISDLSASPTASSVSQGLLEMIKAEAGSLRMRIQELEREQETARQTYRRCKAEVSELRRKTGQSVDDLDESYPPILERRASQSSIASNHSALQAGGLSSSSSLSMSSSALFVQTPMTGSNISGYANSAAMIVPTSPSFGQSSWVGLDRGTRGGDGACNRSGRNSTIELGNWPRGERSSRSVSSTRASLQ